MRHELTDFEWAAIRPFLKTDAIMSYWVYENWTVKKARIHKADCPYCDGGSGLHRRSSRRNGSWHGPCATLPSAARVGANTGQPVSKCSHCAP